MNAHNPLPAACPLGSKASVSLPPLGEALATPIGAKESGSSSSPALAESMTGEACAPNLSPYQLRYDPCTACDTAVTFSCSDCEGTGEVLAGCCVCEALKPLDEDRYCAGCLEPTGWALAERSAFGMGGAR